MKNIYVVVIILMICFNTGYNETIYQVEPQSENNRIILTIDNTSLSVDAGDIEVILKHCPEFVLFEEEKVNCQDIQAGNSSAVELTFNVLRNAPVNKKDTLEFEISEKNGGVWDKQIIIEYLPPREFTLEQNFPNPFNPITTIRYQLPKTAHVELEIFNTLGQRVVTLVTKEQEAGYYDVKFNASKFASGVYMYQLKTNSGYIKTKRLVLLK